MLVKNGALPPVFFFAEKTCTAWQTNGNTYSEHMSCDSTANTSNKYVRIGGATKVHSVDYATDIDSSIRFNNATFQR